MLYTLTDVEQPRVRSVKTKMSLVRKGLDIVQSPKQTTWIAPLLVLADTALSSLIVWKIPCRSTLSTQKRTVKLTYTQIPRSIGKPTINRSLSTSQENATTPRSPATQGLWSIQQRTSTSTASCTTSQTRAPTSSLRSTSSSACTLPRSAWSSQPTDKPTSRHGCCRCLC